MPVDISLPDAAATLRVGEALAGGVAAGRVLHLRGGLGAAGGRLAGAGGRGRGGGRGGGPRPARGGRGRGGEGGGGGGGAGGGGVGGGAEEPLQPAGKT